MRRTRVLRRLLVKYRASGKIDKHLYHELYHLSKGNTFKHKRALVEHVSCLESMKFTNHTVSHLSATLFNITYRSTRLRPRSNVKEYSKRRWMPNVQRPRQPARGGRSVYRPSAMLWWRRSQKRNHKWWACNLRYSSEANHRKWHRFGVVLLFYDGWGYAVFYGKIALYSHDALPALGLHSSLYVWANKNLILLISKDAYSG
jgi:hypothetical protein